MICIGGRVFTQKNREEAWRPFPGIIVDADVRSIGAETTHTALLILHFVIELKSLILMGKNYPWPRPDGCPCCGGKLWGHGYTPRFFDGCPGMLWLKRYRCVGCHKVHTLRPKTHWRRFQAGTAEIINSLRTRLEHGWWPKKSSRQRQEYWLQGFRTQRNVLHAADGRDRYGCLKDLLTRNVIAATHSLRWRQIMSVKTHSWVPEV